MNSRTGNRVLVVALAEATLDLIEPWAKAGILPQLERLMANGATGRLGSAVPMITPIMWGNLVTGQSAGRHGLFDFWQRGPDGRFRETRGLDLKAPPIWRSLSERGHRCVIVNVPLTFPPEAVNGVMLAGEDAPGAHRSLANPPEIYDELRRAFGRYRLKDIFPGGRKKSDYLTLIPEDVARQAAVVEFLLTRQDWDFAMVFFSASAIAQHYFWADMASEDPDNPFRNVIRDAYRSLDAAIGRLVTACGPETTSFIISECGAGPLESGVQINTWLEQQGFLHRLRSGSRAVGRHVTASLRRNAQGFVQKRLPDNWYYAVNRHLGRLKEWSQTYLAGPDIDWSRTQAFSRGKEGCIFVNRRGRDPHGIVAAGPEYETVRDRLIQRMEGLVNPHNGERAVERVYRAEEIFPGPWCELAPDLIIDFRDGKYLPAEIEREKGQVFVERWRENMNWPTSGSHRRHGVLIANGPAIRAGAIHGAGLLDLAPTWLYCLGQQVPVAMEGRPIAELFGHERSPQAVLR